MVGRYRKVLALVAKGATMAEAYERIGVDRNTIVMSAPFAELAIAAPEKFQSLLEGYKKGDKISKFTEKCKVAAQEEEIEKKIDEMKKKKIKLLPITKKQ